MSVETLKDLWIHAKNCGDNTKVIPLSLVKEKAIKWIKEDLNKRPSNIITEGVIDWIKHFFNITKSEINNEK